MTAKSFHISDILSVSTGALVSNRRLDGLFDLMSHITGDDDLSVIDLSASAPAARQFLAETLPWTKDIRFPTLPAHMTRDESEAFTSRFVKEVAAQYGEVHEVEQLAERRDVSSGADAAFASRVRNGRTSHSVE